MESGLWTTHGFKGATVGARAAVSAGETAGTGAANCPGAAAGAGAASCTGAASGTGASSCKGGVAGAASCTGAATTAGAAIVAGGGFSGGGAVAGGGGGQSGFPPSVSGSSCTTMRASTCSRVSAWSLLPRPHSRIRRWLGWLDGHSHPGHHPIKESGSLPISPDLRTNAK
ncbi:uncharacterized protein LOC127351396 [Dicentrarchus labrax]|uniref:uncharacterized protein LOC127351396 n=1 Tax=Dicentrarchus labrax TaxID=13489 RepID=UPI0021F52588|nr:uncharacterized protein LOC127351396 [Dicentrarchus labrax]